MADWTLAHRGYAIRCSLNITRNLQILRKMFGQVLLLLLLVFCCWSSRSVASIVPFGSSFRYICLLLHLFIATSLTHIILIINCTLLFLRLDRQSFFLPLCLAVTYIIWNNMTEPSTLSLFDRVDDASNFIDSVHNFRVTEKDLVDTGQKSQ